MLQRLHCTAVFLPLLTFLFSRVPNVRPKSELSGCMEGRCERGSPSANSTCHCLPGWMGECCDQCGSRLKISETGTGFGFLIDSPHDYQTQTTCTWIIQAENRPVLFRLHELSTECNWDYLYVFDGDSVNSPLLAVLSGSHPLSSDSISHALYGSGMVDSLIPADNRTELELVAKSGFILLYFYSDRRLVMPGFNLSYTFGGCPFDCHGQGFCEHNSSSCVCYFGFAGPDCSVELCPAHCSGHGVCTGPSQQCVCDSGYYGSDCHQMAVPRHQGHWGSAVDLSTLAGRASHSSIVYNGSVWLFGGYFFQRNVSEQFVRWDISGGVAFPVDFNMSQPHPGSRHGHSAVLYNDSMYVFGGSINNRPTREFWKFNFSSLEWTYVFPVITNLSSPLLNVTGHTATMIGSRMIVIFGLNLEYSYVDTVQEYDIETNVWIHVKTTGLSVIGSMGHSSVYSPQDGLIYVYGGYKPVANSATGTTTSDLLAFDPNLSHWSILVKGSSPRFLHSGILIGRLMVIFGGNSGGSACPSLPSCLSANYLLYDTVKRLWKEFLLPSSVKPRFGHSAFLYGNRMHVFGGFDGTLHSDMFYFQPGHGECSFWSETECNSSQTAGNGSCTWEPSVSACIQSENVSFTNQSCQSFGNCSSCLVSKECFWCESKGLCLSRLLETCATSYTNSSRCSGIRARNSSVTNCLYSGRNCRSVCPISGTCEGCFQGNSKLQCLWCPSQRMCTSANMFVPAFPYGQCLHGMDEQTKDCPLECSSYKSCSDCLSDVSCGWCEDGSMTGQGRCMYGGSRGSFPPPSAHLFTLPTYDFLPFKTSVNSIVSPSNASQNESSTVLPDLTMSLPATTEVTTTPPVNVSRYESCSSERWSFFTCPACQCNGHSTCNNQSQCISCTGNTTGVHCEMCDAFFYGDPRNGGTCERCECNGHGDTCHHQTGQCNCTSVGLTGQTCDRCSSQFISNRGNCYYDLVIDFKYTFDIPVVFPFESAFYQRKITDRKERHFVFENLTSQQVNITLLYSEKDDAQTAILIEEWNFTNTNMIDRRIKPEEFNKAKNVTLFVRVEGFTSPYSFKIGFAEPSTTLGLTEFFLSFFGCFFALLFLAGAIYRVKTKYHQRVARRERNHELEMMAKRPFSKVRVLCDTSNNYKNLYPFSTELCKGASAAVCSFIVKLPVQENGLPATGQSTICFGSSLIVKGKRHEKVNGGTPHSKEIRTSEISL